jgi:tRNA (cytidine/uridine-2'-O-)-methyltransferase
MRISSTRFADPQFKSHNSKTIQNSQFKIAVSLRSPVRTRNPRQRGCVARLCAATGSPLHLIGRLGFSFQHPKAKRAMMDYWEGVQMERHVNYEDFAAATAGRTVWAFSTRAERTFWDARFSPGDVLLFGPESRGLPEPLLAADPDPRPPRPRCFRRPAR